MPISGREAIKILEKHGFVVIRQKGSHVVLSKQSKSGKITTVVPDHKELAKGTIRSIASQAQLNTKELGL